MTTQAKTLGELRRTAYRSQTVRAEIRANLRRKLAAKQELFPGIVGYDRTVIPSIANALLAGHDIILLGLRGQAKSPAFARRRISQESSRTSAGSPPMRRWPIRWR